LGEPLGDAARHLADINFFLAGLETIRAFPLRLGRRQFRDRNPRNLPNGTALPFS
jgi:hypothetical protein